MKLVALPVSLFLNASPVLNFSSAVFLHLLLNILIWVIVLWSYKPSKDELDGLWLPKPSLCEYPYVKKKGENQSNGNAESSCEVAGDTYSKSKSENHRNEKDRDNDNGKDNDEKHSCSDGCNEDDYNNGSASVIGCQDVAEEFDDNLEKRIEDFIAKVNKGWREEMLREGTNKQSPSS
jgi:hypothetical protein